MAEIGLMMISRSVILLIDQSRGKNRYLTVGCWFAISSTIIKSNPIVGVENCEG